MIDLITKNTLHISKKLRGCLDDDTFEKIEGMLETIRILSDAKTNEPTTEDNTSEANLTIPDVSNQRKLLIAFTEWFKENGGFPIDDWEVKEYVDNYLKSNL